MKPQELLDFLNKWVMGTDLDDTYIEDIEVIGDRITLTRVIHPIIPPENIEFKEKL